MDAGESPGGRPYSTAVIRYKLFRCSLEGRPKEHKAGGHLLYHFDLLVATRPLSTTRATNMYGTTSDAETCGLSVPARLRLIGMSTRIASSTATVPSQRQCKRGPAFQAVLCESPGRYSLNQMCIDEKQLDPIQRGEAESRYAHCTQMISLALFGKCYAKKISVRRHTESVYWSSQTRRDVLRVCSRQLPPHGQEQRPGTSEPFRC